MEHVLSETYFVSAGDANAEQELSLTHLTEQLIDIATEHANRLGVGNPAMENMTAGWVLSRLTFEMNSYPRVNTEYTVSTWVEEWNRHFSIRAFRFASAAGEIYGYARSIWMVLDTERRTNVGLSHLILPDGVVCNDRAPIARQTQHFSIVEASGNVIPAKGEIIENRPPAFYTFKYCDLDSYRHVNTVRYIVLLLNQYSLEELDKNRIQRLELSFMREARYGMETKLMRYNGDDNVSSFLLKHEQTPLLFARIKTVPYSTQIQ